MHRTLLTSKASQLLIIAIVLMAVFCISYLPYKASAQTTATTAALENPIGESNPYIIIGKIVNVVLGIVGILALIQFIRAGLSLLTAGGNPEKVKSGWKRMLWTAIGMLVIFSSAILTNFVLNTATKIAAP